MEFFNPTYYLVYNLDRLKTRTLIVSLEAIILMSILLMTQTRQAKKDDLRDEADYQADKNSELEINEIKKIVDEINRKLK